jgi:hypothetical protein
MVKKAEVVRKRSPMLPVYGLIIAVVLWVLAMLAAEPAVGLLQKGYRDFRPSGTYFSVTQVPPDNHLSVKFPSGEKLGTTFAIWLFFLVFAYAFVAIAIGRHPDSAKDIKLPPRDIRKR